MSILRFSRLFFFKSIFVAILALQLTACLNGNSPAEAAAVLIGGSNDKVSSVAAKSLNLTWVAPSTREDGVGLSLSEISGYRIYYGTESGKYLNQIEVSDGSADQAEITGLEAASTFYVVMTTVDTAGRESAYSEEVVINI